MAEKLCTRCKIKKPFNSFHKRKGTKQGIVSHCKVCCSEKRKLHHDKNKLKYNKMSLAYYYNNKEKIQTKQKEWAKKNKDKQAEYRKNWKKENKSRQNKLSAKRLRIKRKNDPVFALAQNVRRRINLGLSLYNAKKDKKSEKYVGMSWSCLWNYLCATFEENYGMPREWLTYFNYHIDHIIPISTATNTQEVLLLNHYSNLQILLAEDNIKKHNKTVWELF